MAEQTNRWWEFYFVRYFVGTIVGAVVVAAILFNKHSHLSQLTSYNIKEITDLKAEHFWVSVILGLAFCYISSAPILVFHAYRAHFDFKKRLTLLGFSTILLLFLLSYTASYLWVVRDVNFLRNVGFIGCTVAIILLQFTLVLIGLWNKLNKVHSYYVKLANNRAVNAQAVKEYVESYRHLREHGNAFIIVVFEIVLGTSLFVSSSVGDALALLIFWLLPSLTVWFVGTFLESEI